MTIRITSGVAHLVAEVQKFLDEHGVSAVVAFGKKALTSHVNQGPGRANRIVFVPVDPKSGANGRLLPPSQFGERDIMSDEHPTLRVGAGRALWDWERDMLLSVWSYDGTKAEDELAQETASQFLVEWAIRAIHHVAHEAAQLGAASGPVQGERPFGLEVRIAMKFTHPLYDVPQDVGHPGFAISKD